MHNRGFESLRLSPIVILTLGILVITSLPLLVVASSPFWQLPWFYLLTPEKKKNKVLDPTEELNVPHYT